MLNILYTIYRHSMHSNSTNKITFENVVRGITRSTTRGYHNLNNEDVNVIAGNPHIHFNEKQMMHDERAEEFHFQKSKDKQYNQQIIDDGHWLAENNRMGGFRSASVFEGTMPVNARKAYERDFRPNMVGDVQAGGAFMGGLLAETLSKPRDEDFPEPMGAPNTNVLPSGVALKQVAPFPIRLKVMPKNIAHYSEAIPPAAPIGDAF